MSHYYVLKTASNYYVGEGTVTDDFERAKRFPTFKQAVEFLKKNPTHGTWTVVEMMSSKA